MNTEKVTRLEVIDSNGRSYVNSSVSNLELSLKDDGKTLNEFCNQVFQQNKNAGWWSDLYTGEDLSDFESDSHRNVGETLMLVVTEIAEAMEGHRKGLMDDHLPERTMLEVELADAVIRIADLAGAMDLDLGGAIMEKLAYNKQRADHKVENRLADNGKKV